VLAPRLWNLLKLVIAGALFWYLIETGRLDVANLRLAAERLDLFGLAVVLLALGTLITVHRWRVILASQNILLGFGQALRLTLVGYLFSATLPGMLGGDFVKSYYVAKVRVRRRRSLSLSSSIVFSDCTRCLSLRSSR